mgnify:FL=1
MAISPMQKVHIFAYDQAASKVLKILQGLEIIEIIDIDEDVTVGLRDLAEGHTLQGALDFLHEQFPKQKNIIENFIAVKIITSADRVKLVMKQRKQLLEAAVDILELKARWEQCQQEIRQLQADAARYQLYSSFPVKIVKLPKLKKVGFMFNVISEARYANFITKKANLWRAEHKVLHWEVVSRSDDQV